MVPTCWIGHHLRAVHLPDRDAVGGVVEQQQVGFRVGVEVGPERKTCQDGHVVEGQPLDMGQGVQAVGAGDLKAIADVRDGVGGTETGEDRGVDARAAVDDVVAGAAGE